MDEQEMQRLMQQALEEVRTLGTVSADTAKKLDAAGDELGSFKAALKKQTEQFTRNMISLTRSVGEGNTEFTVFNSTVDSVTGALTEMGKAIPFFGAAMVAAGEGAKFLLGQLQATTKAFNQVGDAGLAGAEGMSGLRDQFQTAGIDLQTFTKVITGNSEALARFGGTAADGAQRFSRALGQVNRDFGTQLMSLGNSFEAVAEQTASYIAMQSRLGRAQNMTQAQLAKGAFEYARELDALAKLTGQQKNQIIKQQDAALSESRFRAKYEDMVAKGRVKEAKAMLDFQTRVSAVSPVLGQGLRDIASGFVNTEAAQAAFITTGGRAATIMQQLSAGTISQEQAFAELQAANKQTIPLQRSLAMAVGDLPGVMIPFAQSADFANQKLAEFGQVAAVQSQQMAGADGLTQSAVAAQQAMMRFSLAINELATQALPKAGTAVAAFADVTTKAVQAISKATGVQVQMPQRQYAEGGIARGPESGYLAALHGTEAVVPLPDGQQIPVQFESPSREQLQKLYGTMGQMMSGLQSGTTSPGTLSQGSSIADKLYTAVTNMGKAVNTQMVRTMLAAPESKVFAGQNMMDLGSMQGPPGDEGIRVRQQLSQLQEQIRVQDLASIRGGRNTGAAIEDPLSRMEVLVQDYEARQAARDARAAVDYQATDNKDRLMESNQQMIQVLQELVSLQRAQNSTSTKILQASTN
jgi:hypothetical protein